jgi:carbon monoxide dehydrogenase subunit G
VDFRIDSVVAATPAQLWTIFFDIQRIARLIPGCENVEEKSALKDYTAVMKQKIGPFKFEMQTEIQVEKLVAEKCVQLRATGRDKFTGTTIAVLLDVNMESQGVPSAVEAPRCRLDVAATMQVGGRLASLGFGVIKKKSEELFAEFDKRLKAELEAL